MARQSALRSAGAPICCRGRMVLYRWRVVKDTRTRSAGARTRACQTSAAEGEEEWRIASADVLTQILHCTPHVASLCLAGPLRSSSNWIEITRELREEREVCVQFE
mmetsp:Transcript_85143/g.133054  ORF Transcript_85143/g.133054 Transcript_85143/m.133054 type:complete len:106 (+) Transcript_85143:1-318(+)